MPELPEVETIARELRETQLIGKTIDRAVVFWERSIANLIPKQFSKEIKNKTIQNITRRGKYLVFTLSDGWTLLVHLRMTGKFMIDVKEGDPHSHERVRLYLNDGRILRYEDQRKFGKWTLTQHPESILDVIGLEPLDTEFTLKAFKHLIKDKKRQIKPLLLDQHMIAGIGNIYADEALWEARIHPACSAASLSDVEVKALYQAIIMVLKAGVENIGTSLGAARANYFSVSGRRGNNQYKLKVFRRESLPCFRCGTIIEKIVLAQRGTHFCPVCQLNLSK